RTAAAALVSLVQEGRPVVDALITTGTLDADAAPGWTGEQPPGLPPIEECTDQRPPAGEGFADQVDMRFDRSTMGWLNGWPSRCRNQPRTSGRPLVRRVLARPRR